MAIFFELIKIIFLIASLVIGLFTLRGYYYLPDATFNSMVNMLMPGYLLIVGLMMGYMYTLYVKTKTAGIVTSREYLFGFAGGLVAGFTMAIIYIMTR